MIRGARVVAVAALAALLLVSATTAPAAKRDPTAARPGAAASSAAPTGAPRVHVVGAGDTLAALAKRYGVSVAAIAAANGLTARAKLRPGQRLTIPAAGARPATIAATPRAAKATAERAGPESRRGRRARVAQRGPGRVPADFFFAVPDFAASLSEFLWPVDGVITSSFGRRRLGWHRGIDIKGGQGDPIFAAAEGVVIVSAVEPRYGRVVKIEHEYGFTTVYAHNDENLVRVGDWVGGGQRIASIGRTGRATAHHLHFEIRRETRVYNPLYMLPMPARVAHLEESEEEEPDDL